MELSYVCKKNITVQDTDLLRQQHPCLNRNPGGTGRIHLPVCPDCNLSCRYCSRVFRNAGQVPGLSRNILPVERVSETIGKALSLCPEITTVGIAGPGDTLAGPKALEAFKIVDKEYPELIKCMSTNGLLLPEKTEEISDIHLDSLTVTVNSIDPDIQARIIDRIFYHGQTIKGKEAAEILIANQLNGIKKAADAGIFVKVNIVLIPGINDEHVGEVAKAVSEAGAKLLNVIPLIPQAAMSDVPAPDCEMLDNARRAVAEHIEVFEHCRHCRADAVGRLDKEDLGRLVYEDLKLEDEPFSHG